MIPLGVLASRRADVEGGGVLFSDDFTTVGELSATYDTAVLGKPTPGSSGGGTVFFDGADGSAYATIPSFSHSDVDVSIFGAGNTQIRRHWLIAARVQSGYTLAGFTSGGVISSGYEVKVENDTKLIRLCRNGSSVATAAFTPSGTFGVRLNVVGGSVKARAWLTSGSEPSTWMIDYADGAPLAAGTCGFGCYNSANRAVTAIAPFTVEAL